MRHTFGWLLWLLCPNTSSSQLWLSVIYEIISGHGAVKILSKELPEICAGADIVFSVSIAKKALASGARFIVSSHLDEQIVTYCAGKNVVSVPGVLTPSEVQRSIAAARKGWRREKVKDLNSVIKIFPASTGGPGHIACSRNESSIS